MSNLLRPDEVVVQDTATEKNVDVSFVEKDWFVTQALLCLSRLNIEGFSLVFSGGTALSKAHKLIQRFSEDIDFRIATDGRKPSRKALSQLKKTIVTELRSFGFTIDDSRIRARNQNQFFAIEIEYPYSFTHSDALRPHLKIEMTVNDPQLPPQTCSITSFISELKKDPAEVEAISCVLPVENAADKLSALAWRVPDRVRGRADDDPTIVRHLHDLAILKPLAEEDARFINVVQTAVVRDIGRARDDSINSLSFNERCQVMMLRLRSDEQYSNEYQRFVAAMSYATVTPSFDEALEAVSTLVERVLE